ncbi:MAG: NUDIX hydrolase [Elainellaceae cyanobacterium]
MEHASQHIRAIALGWIRQGDRVLLAEGFDEVKQSHFYRALGGGIDFGERSVDALRREFQEELGAELQNITLLDCIENIFMLNGKPGHEVVFLYQCDLVDATFYDREDIQFQEGDTWHMARWVECDRLTSGELRLVPPACLAYL